MIYKEFKKKNYLLVGAANGLGNALAGELAQSGANLFLVDIDKKLEVLCRTLAKKTKCRGYICDVLDHERAADHLVKLIGREGFDGVIYFPRGRQRYSLSEMDEEKWQKDFGLTVHSLMHLVHRLWKKRKINDRASLVFLSSVCAKLSGSESLSYHMSKSALESMGRYLANELGSSHIRVNTLQLGIFIRDQDQKRFYAKGNEAYRAWIEGVQPLKRVGHLKDITGPIKFLLSDESAYISGQVLCVDGGMTIQEPSHLVRNFLDNGGKRL